MQTTLAANVIASTPIPTIERLLYSRIDAAKMLSISPRALDYLIAGQRLATRRIGSRILVPADELKRFIRKDHPFALAG